MTPTRRPLVAVLAIIAWAVGMTSAAAKAAGTRAGATRAAKRREVTYVERYAVALRSVALDLHCSVIGRSRWKLF